MNSETSPELNQRLVDALASNDMTALRSLVAEHGPDVKLRMVFPEDSDGDHIVMAGGPINIATYIKNLDAVTFLAGQGALQEQGVHETENHSGWYTVCITPMAQAIGLGSHQVAAALMSSQALVDWDDQAILDQDNFPTAYTEESLLHTLVLSQERMEFIVHIGFFRGSVTGKLVTIAPTAEGFCTTVEGRTIAHHQSMAAAVTEVYDTMLRPVDPVPTIRDYYAHEDALNDEFFGDPDGESDDEGKVEEKDKVAFCSQDDDVPF